MAWNLRAIEQMQLRGRRRVDGVGRPKFDSTQARTYPRPYSVWRQCGLDEDVEGGYAFVKNFFSQPNDEMLEELFDEVYGTNTGGPMDEADGGGGNLFDGIGKFIDAFQKL